MGVKWHESLSIGVAAIDAQHKELVSRFDQLLDACEKNLGADELRRLLSFLDEYVIKHFHDEEELQLNNKYPGYEAHRKEHESFIVRINDLKSNICREGVTTHHIIETNNLLVKWLLNHISTSDTDIGRFLKKSKV